ncbi:transcriptional regulator, LacI family [Beutenbergia cavernae DSM 12333]|uniref:Transcriptional regulator, LacI family n=1 Tax=Beutenbergia cavernae (strain ATCC BAA-8 / DSM 12333 / CCUG 43141 / JCM 11478 / NBRC 16432 / NCIMB 13614 / HKI 0122) TaxID=471853 RepID=C5C4Q8_BEUC1|nr:LacI family DNA-binding transcriptional regulator [Beutenbergia cavernae]ACQ80036.1 transcriptional regulator, LacI family [Beutenbergia cavernae DSM 12333]
MAGSTTRTRLKDLAEQAGVSTATVSRVLNRKPGVAEETRRAVYEALDLLGYERTRLPEATSAGLVGLVLPELTNPVFPAFAQSIETVLAHHGYTPMLCTQTSSGATEDEYVETLLAADAAGIVFVSGLHADTQAPVDRYERLHTRGVPFVLVNGKPERLDASAVSADERLSMHLAVRHLVSLGHTRIALAIGPSRLLPAVLKRDGFIKALADHVGTDDGEEHVRTTLFTVEGGQAAGRELVREGYTAIVCGSDLMALGAIRAVRSAGLRVPEDVSVIGYDDSPLMPFTDPPLTTLRQPVEAMSQAAVNTLLAEIAGSPARPELLFDPELIVRGSTGPVPKAAPPS